MYFVVIFTGVCFLAAGFIVGTLWAFQPDAYKAQMRYHVESEVYHECFWQRMTNTLIERVLNSGQDPSAILTEVRRLFKENELKQAVLRLKSYKP